MALLPGRPFVAIRKKVETIVTPVDPGTPGGSTGAAGGSLFPIGPGNWGVGPLGYMPAGQSNCLLFCDYYSAPGGYMPIWRYLDNFRDLTKIPQNQSQEYYARSDQTTGPANLFAGTNLYHNQVGGDPKWMDPVGYNLSDPSTWANTDIMTRFLNYAASKQNLIAQDRPFFLDIMWNEYPSKLGSTEIAVYEKALLEFIKRWRAVMGTRGTSLLPVILSNVAYDSGVNDNAMKTIRDAWRNIALVAANNVFIGAGGIEDATGDGSHWDVDGANRLARRKTLTLSRIAYDNKLVPGNTDLSYLPRLGPTIVSLARVSTDATKLRAGILHDGLADDMVAPTGTPDYGNFKVTDNDTRVNVSNITRYDANTLEFTMASPISGNGIVKLDYGIRTPFNGPGSQWTDNWHLKTKPASYNAVPDLAGVKMILNRFGGVVTLGTTNTGGAGNAGGTGGGGSVVVPTPTPDWAPNALTALVFAGNANDTASAADAGGGHVASFKHLYSSAALTSPTATTQPLIATGGVSNDKRIMTFGSGRYLGGTFAALLAAFTGPMVSKSFSVSQAVKFSEAFYTGESFVASNADMSKYYDVYRRTGPDSIEFRARDGSNYRTLIERNNTGWHLVTIIKDGATLILRVDGTEIGRASYTGSGTADIVNVLVNARNVNGTIETDLSDGVEAMSGMIVTSNALSGQELIGTEYWISKTAGMTGYPVPTGTTTPPANNVDPSTQTITYDPTSLGTRAPGTQAVVINTTNIDSLTWTRVGPAPNYAFLGGAEDNGQPTTIPTTGSVTINPKWTESGQRIKSWPTGNIQKYADSSVVTITQTSTTPPAAGSDRAFAHDFVKDLRTGANIERNNTDFVTTAWLNDIVDADMSHLRLYPYSNADLGFMTNDQLMGHINAINKIMAETSLKVMFEFQDVTSIGAMNNAGTLPYILRVCDLVNAQNWNPARFTVGHTQEMANAGNDTFNAVSNSLLDQMRARLKDTTLLSQSGGDWGHPDTLVQSSFQLGSDKRRVYNWHYYEWDYANKDAYGAKYNAVKTWAAANGVEFCNAEFGKYDPNFNDRDYDKQPSVIDAYAKGCGGGGTIWTFTRGSGWRLNVDGADANGNISAAGKLMRPEVKTAIKAANTYIRGLSTYNT